ncbi:MAG TPA: hypothetical protein VG755_33945 [Nannocystaceae bacterium]|nr:hypothetical protein [Nannocystaceae bacterium]
MPVAFADACALDCGVMRVARSWCCFGAVVLCACDLAQAIAAGKDAEAEAIEAGAAVSEAEADRFVGQYAFAGGEAQRAALRDAIEELVLQLTALIRGVAREKLTETNPVFEQVSIERRSGELVLRYGSLTNVCKLDGSASEVEGIDGSALKCRLSMQGDALVHRVDGARGGRVNTFTIGKNGRLTMKTRIHSKMMPADLRYTLTFAR